MPLKETSFEGKRQTEEEWLPATWTLGFIEMKLGGSQYRQEVLSKPSKHSSHLIIYRPAISHCHCQT
jgi:hypothetical protein